MQDIRDLLESAYTHQPPSAPTAPLVYPEHLEPPVPEGHLEALEPQARTVSPAALERLGLLVPPEHQEHLV